MTAANSLATSVGSMPAALSASTSLILIAVTSSSVSTRRVVRSQTSSGTPTAVVAREDFAEPLCARRLVQVVDLLEARQRELLDERGHVDPIRDEAHAAQPAGDSARALKVDVDDLVDARTLNLDDYTEQARFSGIELGEPGSVGLTEGCRGQRCLVDRTRTPARAAHPVRPRRVSRIAGNGTGRNLVLQTLELVRDLGRQHVEP